MGEAVWRARPAVVSGYTQQILAPEGTVNVTVNSDADGPFEVFLNVGRAGSDLAAWTEGLGRLLSMVLRLPSSFSPAERQVLVEEQLRGLGGSRVVGNGAERVRSLPDAVARVMAAYDETVDTLAKLDTTRSDRV